MASRFPQRPSNNALLLALGALSSLALVAALAPRLNSVAVFVLTGGVVSVVALVVSGRYAASIVCGKGSRAQVQVGESPESTCAEEP